MNLNKRLEKLEDKLIVNDSDVLDIIIVKFVGAGELNDEINHIWASGLDIYREDGEFEEAFKDRACAEIRRVKEIEPNNRLLVFGDSKARMNK